MKNAHPLILLAGSLVLFFILPGCQNKSFPPSKKKNLKVQGTLFQTSSTTQKETSEKKVEKVIQKPEKKETEYPEVHFKILADFEHQPVGYMNHLGETEKEYKIPLEVLKLDKTIITVEGHMLPMESEEGKTKKFLLLAYQSECCYGPTPQINHWINVTMKDKQQVRVIPKFMRCRVTGVLSIEKKYGENSFESLYYMEGIKVAETSTHSETNAPK